MISLALMSLLALSAAPPAAPPPDPAATRARAEKLLEEISAVEGMRPRVVAAGERLVGTQYRFDPLGEGPGLPPDEDPRLRFDQVDCQTYVETVLALARARSWDALLSTMDDIRYAAGAQYAQRNHFFEAQWAASNEKKGFIREVTSEVGGERAVEHVKVVTAELWEGRDEAKRIKLPKERAPIGRFPAPYVPIDKVLEIANAIPDGAVFAVVREDRPKTPYMVSHMGFIVHEEGKTYARHAGSGPVWRVVDEELPHFVARSKKLGPWKVIGMRFFEPLEGQQAP